MAIIVKDFDDLSDWELNHQWRCDDVYITPIPGMPAFLIDDRFYFVREKPMAYVKTQMCIVYSLVYPDHQIPFSEN